MGEVRQEDRPIRTGGTPMPPLGEEQLLEAIAAGDRAAADIAREAGMSILELARIVTTPRNLEALGRVAQLHAIEREMLLGRLKRDALVRLGELTDEVPAGSADEVRAAEVMRKACADLLRYGGLNTEKRHSEPGESGGPRGGGPGSRGYHPESITPAFEAEVLEALERLGEEKYEYETRVPGKPQGSPRRTSGSVERTPPETTIRTRTRRVPRLEEAITRTGETPVPPLGEAASHGCHGQVPPARVCEKPTHPRAKPLKQRPCPWHPASGSFTHPTRIPPHQPRPPPCSIFPNA